MATPKTLTVQQTAVTASLKSSALAPEPPHLDAAALAAILVAATDGLKDLSDILDPPSRARRGFERRMQHLTEVVEALTVRR